MKIDAKIELSDTKSKDCNQTYVRVSVDTDYVEGNEEAVNEWIANELEEMFGGSFCPGTDFAVTNMEDIIEDIAFDEFKDKTEVYKTEV